MSAAPLLTGAAAFRADAPQPIEAWLAEFLAALAEEAEAGIALLRLLEREWFAARAAIRGRRRDSHAAAAVDLMAAAPIVSATSLAHSLDIAVKNAATLLDGFVARGIAIEVTHRSKRRLFGLKHLAPLRAEAALPRRVLRRRAHMAGRGNGADDADPPDTPPPVLEPLRLTPLERKEFEFSDLDDWMREADQLIRRSQAVLDSLAQRASGDAAVRRCVIPEEARGHRPGDPLPGVPMGSGPVPALARPRKSPPRKAIVLPGVLAYRKIRVRVRRLDTSAAPHEDADATDLHRARIRMNEGKPRRDSRRGVAVSGRAAPTARCGWRRLRPDARA